MLIDFGRATHLDRADRLEGLKPLGTSLFQAPEVENKAAYGQQSDMWAVGVLIYLFVSGRMPFEHSVTGLYKVLAGEYAPFDETFSEEAKNLVSSLLVVDPDKRMNAAQCAQHPFFSKEGLSAAKRIMAKLPRSVVASSGCIAALELHKTIVTRTCELLASKLDVEEATTLQRWISMSAEEIYLSSDKTSTEDYIFSSLEESVRGGNVNNGKDQAATVLGGRGTVFRGENSGSFRWVGRGSDSGGGSDDNRNKSLEELYLELRKVGETSVRVRRRVQGVGETGGVEGESPPPLPLPLPPLPPGRMTRVQSHTSIVDTAPSLPLQSGDKEDDDGKNTTTDPTDALERLSATQTESSRGMVKSDSHSGLSFLSVAHRHGLCSLDELIMACLSLGRVDVSAELEVAKSELREQRMQSLISAGVKSTHSSNALLDTMLFRSG